MARFVMASRRAGKFSNQEKTDAVAAFESFAEKRVAPAAQAMARASVKKETDRRIVVFEADPVEVSSLQRDLPGDVMLEPEILYRPSPILPLGDFGARLAAPQGTTSIFGGGETLTLRIRGSGGPLQHAEVHVSLTSAFGIGDRLSGVSDADGEVVFRYPSFLNPVEAIVVPYSGHWTMLVRGPRGTVRVRCAKLPANGPRNWWHRAAGLVSGDGLTLGEGIKVGVIDTGCGPHPNLEHVQLAGSVINGVHDDKAAAGKDVDAHGTHVSGIIGARHRERSEFQGIAPASTLTSLRVFPDAAGANQGDIAQAIEILSKDHAADLINMSLGGPASDILHDAIIDAFERGTLSIAAAGNSAGPVEFPAGHPEVVAVAALGVLGLAPDGSLAAARVPQDPSLIGQHGAFLANFSCFGPEIEVASSGVGIISTVPERHGLASPYAAFDGTSMAAPAATATLSAILARQSSYQGMARNQARAEFARAMLLQFTYDLGLSSLAQGRGLPNLRVADINRAATLRI